MFAFLMTRAILAQGLSVSPFSATLGEFPYISHLLRFKELVQTGGPWDFKKNLLLMNNNDKVVCPACKKAVTLCGICIQYEAVSNIHYGYVALKACIGRRFAEYGAGIAQIHDNKKRNWIISALNALTTEHYGDEPEDNLAIKIGFEYYKTGDLCSIIQKMASDLKNVDSVCKPRDETGTPPNIKEVKSW